MDSDRLHQWCPHCKGITPHYLDPRYPSRDRCRWYRDHGRSRQALIATLRRRSRAETTGDAPWT